MKMIYECLVFHIKGWLLGIFQQTILPTDIILAKLHVQFGQTLGVIHPCYPNQLLWHGLGDGGKRRRCWPPSVARLGLLWKPDFFTPTPWALNTPYRWSPISIPYEKLWFPGVQRVRGKGFAIIIHQWIDRSSGSTMPWIYLQDQAPFLWTVDPAMFHEPAIIPWFLSVFFFHSSSTFFSWISPWHRSRCGWVPSPIPGSLGPWVPGRWCESFHEASSVTGTWRRGFPKIPSSLVGLFWLENPIVRNGWWLGVALWLRKPPNVALRRTFQDDFSVLFF